MRTGIAQHTPHRPARKVTVSLLTLPALDVFWDFTSEAMKPPWQLLVAHARGGANRETG